MLFATLFFVMIAGLKSVLGKFKGLANYSVPFANCTYLDFSTYTTLAIMMMDHTNSTAYLFKGFSSSLISIDLLEPV